MFKLSLIKVFFICGPAIISATVLLSTTAFAVEKNIQLTGESFSNSCTRADESWISFCNGYIQAAIDSIREDDKICLPVLNHEHQY